MESQPQPAETSHRFRLQRLFHFLFDHIQNEGISRHAIQHHDTPQEQLEFGWDSLGNYVSKEQ